MTAQALPDNYPSLQQLYQMAPLMAFAQAGDQQRIADENNPRLQQAFDMNMQQDQQMQPLKLAQLAAGNAHTEAQTGLLGQQAEAARLANAFTGQTQPGSIGATNSKNTRLQDEDLVGSMEAKGRVYGQMAARLQDPSLTPWERVNLVKQEMGEHAGRFPGLETMLMNNHGDLAGKFQKLSEDSYAQSKEARKAKAEEERRIAMIQEQGQNALDLQEARARSAIATMSIKASMKPAKDENMSVYEARIRREAGTGNADAILALNVLTSNRMAQAQASGALGDDRIRGLIPQLGPRNAATPQFTPQAPTPLPAPVQAPAGVPSGPGVNGMPRVPPQGAESRQIIQAGYDRETNPVNKAALARELARLGVNVNAAPAALPAGMKDNGNGTFTLPDGRVVRRKTQ